MKDGALSFAIEPAAPKKPRKKGKAEPVDAK
jgi:ATP-dependent Clp protease ATP-binding subunit ClpA